MNLLSLLDTIGGTSTEPLAPQVATTILTNRRGILRSAGQTGLQMLAAAIPVVTALSALAGTNTETVFDSLKLLLTLADLQEALYTKALTTAGLVPAAVRSDIDLIRQQQQQQVVFLRSLFVSAGVAVPPVPTFDFTGSRNATEPAQFADVFTSFDKFLQLAQPLADAAARFYLGQLTAFYPNRQLLEVLVHRQAVEARHASHLRTLRRGSSALPKSWPSPADPAVPAALATIQAGESNFDQLVPGVAPSGSSGTTGGFAGLRYINFNALFLDTPVQTTALTEAFDEPLPTQQAVALLALFQ